MAYSGIVRITVDLDDGVFRVMEQLALEKQDSLRRVLSTLVFKRYSPPKQLLRGAARSLCCREKQELGLLPLKP